MFTDKKPLEENEVANSSFLLISSRITKAGCESFIKRKASGMRKIFFETTSRNCEKVQNRGRKQNIPKDKDRARVSLLVKHGAVLVRI